jgi:hypothetical protein
MVGGDYKYPCHQCTTNRDQQVVPSFIGCTVRLTSTVNWVPGNQEFCLAPSETIVELVKKQEVSLRV